jgi:hypothetical protein
VIVEEVSQELGKHDTIFNFKVQTYQLLENNTHCSRQKLSITNDSRQEELSITNHSIL